ncbi:hypothetical protein [Nonomuraea sp. NPDC050202]|uniref:NACHT domain-containing protein n=1 Tax=Nonomuraea sp. NPDC050202 TaxID=3155035 RepID=UPI0033C7A9CC
MRQILTYHDAVVLLGGPSRITNLLDRASSLALFGMQAVDLFDARAEAVRLGDAFIRTLRDKVKGLSRYDATQRLVAAHSVIVATAYLEALAEVDVLRELTPEDQRRITQTDGHPIRIVPLPLPTPAHPYEYVLGELETLYRTVFTDPLLSFVQGLAVWDTWDETTRSRLFDEVPARALLRYEELFRRLAAEFPEVACWSDRIDHQATRAELSRGLAGIHEQLARIPSSRTLSDRLAALIRSNKAALKRPIVSSARMPAGMAIPTLDEGYVNPGYRLMSGAHRSIALEEDWARLPHRRDLDAFLSGHLTLPQATEAPLLVLGQPGAGKSVLTRMLAARLPATEFLPLRVELRGVPADADVLAQIEHGIRAALDEQMSWPEFAYAAEGALPVVMLDGFDELLQATGVNQTDYLERVAQFQRDQAEKERALAVVVTSRIAVADRARLPEGSYVIRLEPFGDDQIRRWVTTWNDANHEYFLGRGLLPLPLDRVLAVPKLGEQPLLLLMLALYDADANALRHLREDLHEAELYERLLHDFAVREVGKSRPHLADDDLGQAVEDELRRLSITAFAMFNRGLQWIAEQDLDADLRALRPQEAHRPRGLRRPLSPAEGVIGGFFFIHTTQALRDEQRLKTYEFLHATFGEYLVARMVVRELVEMAEELAFAESRRRPVRASDDLLQALLSFAALSVRAPTVDFLKHGIAGQVPGNRRALLTRHLCELFAQSLQAGPGAAYDAYQPVRAELTARCAAYSVNLMLLAVLSSDEPLSGAELFDVEQPEHANERWRRIARLWHSQLSRAEWDSLMRTIWVRHFLRNETRVLQLEFNRNPPYDLRETVFFSWPQPLPNYPYQHRASGAAPTTSWMRTISFRDDSEMAHLFLDLLPYAVEIGGRLDAQPQSPVTHLLRLLLSDTPHLDLYMQCLGHAPNTRYVDRVLRQLEADAHTLPSRDVATILRLALDSVYDGKKHGRRVHRILRVLKDRADRDPQVLREVGELFSWQPHDQPGLRPVLDPEVSPVGPGDVAGDRQP